MKFDPDRYDEYEQFHTESLAIAKSEGIEQGREEGIEQGIEQGREEGIEQGIEQGREESMEEVALALKGHVPIELLSEVTGLTPTQIENLK